MKYLSKFDKWWKTEGSKLPKDTASRGYAHAAWDARHTQDTKTEYPKCELCGKPIPDYKPQYCCSGKDCACRGMLIYPPWCDECWRKTIGTGTQTDKGE